VITSVTSTSVQNCCKSSMGGLWANTWNITKISFICPFLRNSQDRLFDGFSRFMDQMMGIYGRIWFLPREAMLSAVYAVVVCVCVCVSVTLRYCIKTAKRRITQTTLHDSPMTSFLMPKIMAKFEREHPLRGRQMQVGWVKIGQFRRKTRYNSKMVQDRRIVSIKVE